MNDTDYRAMVVRETEDGGIARDVSRRRIGDLPAEEVLIRVVYSSLNYKDALSASGNRGVTKQYPHTPGIDAAGTVVESSHRSFEAGSPVIVSGFDLGVSTPGGFGEFVRVPSAWVMPKPRNLSLRECMIYGSAGFTAGLCLQRLLDLGVSADSGDILVTGASGGVGSFAVGILAKCGFKVTAATGKSDATDYLKGLGASEIISRETVLDTSGRPLLSRRWAAAVDTVGGPILATVLRSVRENGIVTCCGNAASPELSLTVYPFILRGVTLCGIDAAQCPVAVRRRIWSRLAGEWSFDRLESIARDTTLEELSEQIDRILKGDIMGRVVVQVGE